MSISSKQCLDHVLGRPEILKWIEKEIIEFRKQRNPIVMDSIRQGETLTRELVNAADSRFIPVARMRSEVFAGLLQKLKQLGLAPSRYVSAEEKLLIFLYISGENASNRNAREYFQHSGSTISKYFREVLDACVLLAKQLIQLPTDLTDHPKLREARYAPFTGCLGAFDGTHIPVLVDKHVQNPVTWRNRKGVNSTNVFAAVSFDMKFLCIVPSWAGSKHDSSVLDYAESHGLFRTPPGHYYLADAGYGLRFRRLTPFRGTDYHLPVWRERREKRNDFVNAKEAFNYEHACLRNVVERAFGVLKNRFHILRSTPSHPIRSQLRLVFALCGVHNFILSYGEPESTEMDLLSTAENTSTARNTSNAVDANDVSPLSAEEESASIQAEEESASTLAENTEAEIQFQVPISNRVWDLTRSRGRRIPCT